MKKSIQLLLAACAVLSLWGCSSKAVQQTTEAATTAASTTAATESQKAESGPADTKDLPPYTGGAAELRFSWWGNDERASRYQSYR